MAPAGYTDYTWENDAHGPIRLITVPGSYTVKAINKFGCLVSSTSNIAACGDSVYNVITPGNHDGLNDKFIIRGLVPNSQVTVYNRWGKLVYSIMDYKNDWEGEDCSSGTYFVIYNKHNGIKRTFFLEIVR